MEVKHVSIPKDRFFFVKICTFTIGMTSLLPWNLFITANDYWMYKLRNVSADGLLPNETDEHNLNRLQHDFTSYLVIASNVPFVIFLLVNTLIAHRFSPTMRINWSLSLTILLFAATASVVYVDTDNNQTAFVAGTLASTVVINMVGAFLKGAGTGIAGFLPRSYMNSYVYGQAMGGIFVSAAQILSLLASSSTLTSALAYFLTAVVALILTLVAFVGMAHTDFYKHFFSGQIGKAFQDAETKEKPAGVPFMDLCRQIWVYLVSTFIIFTVTLSAFPAVLVLIKPVDTEASDSYKLFFLPVFCFLIFNVGDIIGRFLASFVTLPGKKGYVELALSVARLIFIPIFLLCNGQPRKYLPVVFNHDAYFATFVALCSITNGFIYAVIMAKAPNVVETQYKETVASMLALFLGLGIMAGSVASYGTIYLF